MISLSVLNRIWKCFQQSFTRLFKAAVLNVWSTTAHLKRIWTFWRLPIYLLNFLVSFWQQQAVLGKTFTHTPPLKNGNRVLYCARKKLHTHTHAQHAYRHAPRRASDTPPGVRLTRPPVRVWHAPPARVWHAPWRASAKKKRQKCKWKARKKV